MFVHKSTVLLSCCLALSATFMNMYKNTKKNSLETNICLKTSLSVYSFLCYSRCQVRSAYNIHVHKKMVKSSTLDYSSIQNTIQHPASKTFTLAFLINITKPHGCYGNEALASPISTIEKRRSRMVRRAWLWSKKSP